MDKNCLNYVFYNENVDYECEMAMDMPVICSVKMKKMKDSKKKKLEVIIK